MSLGNFMEELNSLYWKMEEDENIDVKDLISNGFEFAYSTNGDYDALTFGCFHLLDTVLDDPTLEDLRDNLERIRRAYMIADKVISRVINSVDKVKRQEDFGLYTKKEWEEE